MCNVHVDPDAHRVHEPFRAGDTWRVDRVRMASHAGWRIQIAQHVGSGDSGGSRDWTNGVEATSAFTNKAMCEMVRTYACTAKDTILP